MLYIEERQSHKVAGRERDKSHKRAAAMPKYVIEENLSPGRSVPRKG